jgi:hypothetical protein
MDERETERFKIIQETRKEFEKAQLKQNKEVNQMFELAQKRTQAEIVKNKFNVTNIEETMSDLLGSLNQAHNVVDDYTDSDNTSDSSLSPRNSITNTTTTLDTDETNEVVGNASEVEETTIENIEIIIEDISGN